MRAEAWLLLLWAGAAQPQEEQPPPAGLLEFLGSFETAEGKWIDPTRLELPTPAQSAPADGATEKEERDE